MCSVVVFCASNTIGRKSLSLKEKKSWPNLSRETLMGHEKLPITSIVPFLATKIIMFTIPLCSGNTLDIGFFQM